LVYGTKILYLADNEDEQGESRALHSATLPVIM